MFLRRERELVAEFGRRMSAEGLSNGTSGNLSIYVPKEGYMVLSPSGMRYEDIHKAVHKVQRDIALQAFSLDVEVRHGDGITGAKEPCKAVFLLGRDQGRVRAAHSGGCRSRRGQHANAQRCCQHKRRRAAHKPMQMFQK